MCMYIYIYILYIYTYHILFIHSSINGHLGYYEARNHHKKKSGNSTNTLRLNNMLPNNEWVNQEINKT